MPGRPPNGPHILLLDPAYAPVWRRVMPDVRWSVLGDGEAPSLDPGRAVAPGDRKPFEIARAHKGGFDCVLGELTHGFLWHAIFRLVGDTTPFVLIPRFNHVLAHSTYSLLLSSQLGSPRDLVFASCDAAARSFGAFGFRTDPLFLPGIDLRSFRTLDEPKARVRESLGLPPDTDLLLFVGRLEDDKHLLELLEVLARVRRLRRVELVICYHFYREAYADACRKVAAALGGARFVHAPDRERLVRYYNASDLLVTAAVSVFETFGRAPVEAMACGTVPVVSDYDGFRQTVPDEVGFRVPTVRTKSRHRPDTRALAKTVLAALDDREALAERARAARDQARRFNEPTAIATLRDRLERSMSTAVLPPGDGDGRLTLDGYPEAVREVWGALEGRSLEDLLRRFLTDWSVPVRPPREAIRKYYWSWFSHY